MSEGSDGPGLGPRVFAKRILVCLLLVACVVAVVWAAGELLGCGEPFVDTSRRMESTDSVPSLQPADGRLRFAVATMVSAQATFSAYRQLVQRICRDVGRGEAFVLRPSYAEVRSELEHGRVDVAFVCTGTYVHSPRVVG